MLIRYIDEGSTMISNKIKQPKLASTNLFSGPDTGTTRTLTFLLTGKEMQNWHGIETGREVTLN